MDPCAGLRPDVPHSGGAWSRVQLAVDMVMVARPVQFVAIPDRAGWCTRTRRARVKRLPTCRKADYVTGGGPAEASRWCDLGDVQVAAEAVRVVAGGGPSGPTPASASCVMKPAAPP